MQYILTEEEYNKLRSTQARSLELDKRRLQELCTKIANEMPVTRHWSESDTSPWGCIIHEDDSDREHYSNFGYCDLCPVITICPYQFKECSK